MHRILVFCLVGLFFVFSHGVYGHDIDDGSHHATAGQVVRYNKAIPDGEHLHVKQDGNQTSFMPWPGEPLGIGPGKDGDYRTDEDNTKDYRTNQTPIQQPPPTDVHDHTREEFKEGVAITHKDHPNMNGVEIPDDHVHKSGDTPTNSDGSNIMPDPDTHPDTEPEHFHFYNHNHGSDSNLGESIPCEDNQIQSDHAHKINHSHDGGNLTHRHDKDVLWNDENFNHENNIECQPNLNNSFESNQRNQFDFVVGNDDYQHPISIHNVVYKDKEKPKYIRVNFRNSGENSIRLNENWRFVMIDPVDDTEIIKLYRTFASNNIHYGAVLSSTRNPNKEFETTIAILGNRTAIENFDYSSEKRVKFGLEFRFNSSKVGGYHDHYIFTLQNRDNKLSDWVEIARFPMPEEDIAASPSKIKTMTTTWGSLKKN